MSDWRKQDDRRIGIVDIARSASSLLAVMEREGVVELKDVMRMRMDSKRVNLAYSDDSAGFVDFDVGCSSKDTSALVIDYQTPYLGGLIELRFNRKIDKNRVIIRCKSLISEYVPFCKDSLDNYGQVKIIPSASIEAARVELERLARL